MYLLACMHHKLCCQGTICRSWFIFSTRWPHGIKVISLGLVSSTCILWAISLPLFAVFWGKSNPRILDCVTQGSYLVVEKVRWKWALFLQMSDYPHIFYDFWITFGNPLLWNLSIIPKVFRWSCFCIIYCTISCYFVLPSFLNVKYTV